MSAPYAIPPLVALYLVFALAIVWLILKTIRGGA